MSSPASSCLRCQQPLAVESASGLCVTCAKALETEKHSTTLAVVPAGSATELRSHDHSHETKTGEFDVQADTQLWDGKVRHREMPRGYERIRPLGAGGMGDVYLVHELAADRTVAMKFLREAGDPDSIKRFIKEIQSLAAIDHPNIVRVITPDLDRADPFFTMEFAPGGTLGDRVKANGPMDPDAAARLMVSLARAVSAAHGKNILHRDIKPGNILYDAIDTPKLSDFGLAKRLDDQFDTQTQASRAVGTPPFMPPEAVTRRHGLFSKVSDVYGLGATLYYMLTGQAPFSGDYHEVMRQVERDEPPRPRSINDKIPMGLEAIVLKCLQKKPADRYASAEELAKDLETFLAGGKPTPPPLTRWRRVKKWVGRNRVAIGIVLSVISLGLLFVVFANRTNQIEPTDELAAMKKRLSKGENVVLVPEKGRPRWHQWRLGNATLGPSPVEGDDSCYFSAGESTLLELIDEPPIDRYTISAELRFIGHAAGENLGLVGVWFGWTVPDPGKNGLFARYYSVVFKDVKEGGMTPATESRLRVRDMQWGHRAGGLPMPHPRDFVIREIPLLSSAPGPWRKIEISVSPERIEFRWRPNPDAPMEILSELLRISSDRFSAKMTARPGRPADERDVPAGWSPKLPFGIWADHAGVAFRNVAITPDP